MKKVQAALIALALLLFAVSPAMATVQDVNIVPPAPPTAPASVQVSGITSNQAVVSWAASDSAIQYEVYINGTEYAGSNSPSVTITGLNPYTAYTCYIIADNAGGSSAPSSTNNFKTLPPLPTTPDKPSVTVLATGATVTWQPSPASQYITSYKLYLDGNFLQSVTPTAGIQTLSLANLSPGNHSVSVTAVNLNTESQPSAGAAFTISSIQAPGSLVMTNHSDNTIYFSWQPVQGADHYLIQFNGVTQFETLDTFGQVDNLTPGTSYNIGVVAVGTNGPASAAATLTESTLPAPSPLTPATIETKILGYAGSEQAELIVLFAVVAALSIAGAAKLAMGWQ